MDVLDEEFIRFWRILNANNVRYLMVGGIAIRFHGYNRTTDDVDIWIDDTLPNRQNLRKAFIELGYGDYASIETMQFIPGWTSFYAGGVELYIMTEMKGIMEPFEVCFAKASKVEFAGVNVPFLHINQLIANKKAVNRVKDQMDVIQLEKIKKIRENAQGLG